MREEDYDNQQNTWPSNWWRCANKTHFLLVANGGTASTHCLACQVSAHSSREQQAEETRKGN